MTVSRRTVAKGAAWAAPTLIAAGAAPRLAASPNDPTVSGTVCRLAYGDGSINHQTHYMYLGVTSSDPGGRIPAGSTFTWTVTMSGGGPRTGGTNEAPALSWSRNDSWTLSSSVAEGTATGSFTVTLTVNQDTTAADIGCGPSLYWSDINSIRPGAQVGVTALGSSEGDGGATTGSLAYTVARRHPRNVNDSGRTPHNYTGKDGSQACYPAIQWTRLISNNGYDNVTCYNGASCTPGQSSGPVDGQHVTAERC